MISETGQVRLHKHRIIIITLGVLCINLNCLILLVALNESYTATVSQGYY